LPDYYAILSVPIGASAEQVERAYRLLARMSHPDAFPNDTHGQAWANERMKQINEAYAVLSDPAQRSEYDRSHRAGGASQPSHAQEGLLRCPGCEGEGETLCLTCAGVGTNDCPGCHGHQQVVCPACGGLGALTPVEYERLVEELLRAEAQSPSRGAQRQAPPQSPYSQDLRWSVSVPRRNPETATILSVFLPGVGQIYNGEGPKGLVYLGIAFILFLGIGLLKGVGVLLWLSFWAYNVFDAYSTARGRT